MLPAFEAAIEGALTTIKGASVKRAPLKTIKRALTKTMEENCGDFSLLQDLVRISIECTDYAAMVAVARALKNVNIVFSRFKDRMSPEGGFDSAIIGGYRDVMLNGIFVFDEVEHIVEVQIHHTAFLKIKSSREGHTVYKYARELHGFDTEAVRHEGTVDVAGLDRAAQGLVRFIDASNTELTDDVKQQLVPKVLGNSGCMLLELDLEEVKLPGTWEEIFGGAQLCCPMLRKLSLAYCGLKSLPSFSAMPALVELK